MFPPCAVAGPALTIRKFTRRYSLDELVNGGTLTNPGCAAHARRRDATEHPDFRWDRNRQATLLNALAAHIPDVLIQFIVIEETAEIHLDKPNVLRLEARRASAALGQEQPPAGNDCRPAPRGAPPSPGSRSSLERCVGQAFDLLQALNTGHLG